MDNINPKVLLAIEKDEPDDVLGFCTCNGKIDRDGNIRSKSFWDHCVLDCYNFMYVWDGYTGYNWGDNIVYLDGSNYVQHGGMIWCNACGARLVIDPHSLPELIDYKVARNEFPHVPKGIFNSDYIIYKVTLAKIKRVENYKCSLPVDSFDVMRPSVENQYPPKFDLSHDGAVIKLDCESVNGTTFSYDYSGC